jgi:outer membrane protein assembly factor BamB
MMYGKQVAWTTIGLLGSLIAHAGQAQAATKLTVTVATTTTGTALKASGSGFGDNELVDIFISSPENPISVIASSATGAFSDDLISVNYYGTFTVTAVGEISGRAASTTVTLSQISALDNWPQFAFSTDKSGINTVDQFQIFSGDIYGIQWSVQTGGIVSSSPAVFEGVVYAGSLDKKLYAINASTGKVLWATKTEAGIKSSPAVQNGLVFIGSDDHYLYAMNAATGAVKWKYLTGGAVTSSPLVVSDTVYVGSMDGTLHAVDANTGHKRWAAKTGGAITASPTFDLGRVFIGSSDHKFYAFDAWNGSRLWLFRTKGPIHGSASVANGSVVFGSEDSNVYSLQEYSGSAVWTYQTNGKIDGTPAVNYNSNIYIGSGDGNLYEFSTNYNSQTPNETNYVVGKSIQSAITGSYYSLFFSADKNQLYSIDINNGDNTGISSLVLPEDITSSVTVANGSLYVGTANGRIMAITAPSSTTNGAAQKPLTVLPVKEVTANKSGIN